MTVLNNATAIKLGAIPVNKIMLGILQVWNETLPFDATAEFGANLLWHYEAADSTTLGQTSAGPTGVAQGEHIGYIADKSPTGLHLRQTDNARRIKLGLDAGGRPVFHFDGTKTIRLDSNNIDLSAHSKITVFFAGYASNTDATYKVPFYFIPAGAGGFAVLANGAGGGARVHTGAQQHDVGSLTVGTTPRVYETQFVPAATRVLRAVSVITDGKEWGNGRSSVSDPATPGAFGTGPLRFGDWGALDASWEGGIAAMLAVSGDITDAQKDKVRAYLAGLSGAAYPQPFVPLRYAHAHNYRDTESVFGFATFSYATLYYDTEATQLDLTYYTDGIIAGGYVSLGIYVDGAFHSQINPAAASPSNTATVTLPAGAKRVAIVNSAGSGNGLSNYTLASRVINVAFNAPATRYLPASAERVLVYGDSVATGGHANPLLQHAWPLLLRYQYGRDVSVHAESGAAFKTAYDHATTPYSGGTRDPLVDIVKGFNPTVMWFAMGVNDYGQAGWSAAAFGAAYAEMLDDLHTALPDMVIYAQSPLNPSYGSGANAQGDNLQDYADAIEAACAGRDWVNYVNGAEIITNAAAHLTDGVHPNNAGNAVYAAFVDARLDLGLVDSSFSAASITNVVGYYDMESLATFTQDEAGAAPVTAANQTAKRIIDTSGNGLHLTSPVGMQVRGTPQGPNLLGDNGLFLAGTNAIAGAGWTIGDGRATASAANGALTFPVAATAGKLYLLRYFAFPTAGSVQASFGGAAGVARTGEIIAEEYVTASTTGQLALTGTGLTGYVRNIQVFAADEADVGAPFSLWANGASAFTGASPVTNYPLELHWSGANQAGFAGAVAVMSPADSVNLKGVGDTTNYDWQGGASGAYAPVAGEGIRITRSGTFDATNHRYDAALLSGGQAAHGHTFGTLGTVAVGKMRPSDGYFNGRLCKVAITAGTDATGQALINSQFDAALAAICWGDSMTAGSLGDSWPLYLRTEAGIYTENKGAGGETSTQIRTRFVAENNRKREWINILWMGTNDSPHVSGWGPTLANIAACVADLQGDQRYLVLGVTVAASGVPASYVDNLDVRLADLYGSRYLDIRAYLQSKHDGSVGDLEDVAAGLVPRSLRSDTIHLNGRGKQLTAKCVNERMSQLGWL